MRAFAVPAVAAVLILAAAGLPASACINDREVEASEREFKSQYLEQPAPAVAPPESAPPGEGRLLAHVLSGGGLALLAGAIALGLIRPRP